MKKKKKSVTKRKVAKRKPAAKKSARVKVSKKKITKKKLVIKKPKENIIGIVTHYFPHVNAAVIKLKNTLNAGDTIKIKGHTTDLTQTITSMQIDHVPVASAKKGAEIGLLVNSRVRQHDKVIKI